MHPYSDTEHNQGSFVRIFSKDLDELELIWHRDKNNRTFVVESGVGWKLQMDDDLPITLIQGNSYFIAKNIFHRLWRGNTMLQIRITEAKY